MNNLEVFKNEELFNGEIRSLIIEEKPYFVASDVAKALGYKKPNNAINSYCRSTLKWGIGVETGNKADGTPAIQNIEMNIIPEGDIYRLIMKSKLPKAQEFESWVCDEVLPTIRKTGGFVQEEKEEQFINNMFPALDEETKKVLLRDLIKKNKELKTKADYHDKVLNPTEEGAKFSKLITVTDVAKDLGLTARGLNKLMKENKILFKKSNVWKPYKEYENIIPELMDYHITEYGQSLKFTEKGRKWVIENLEQWKENLEI